MKPLAQLPLTYRVRGGGTTHAPMIRVTLGGRERRLVMDTGSEVHLITSDLADELALDKVPGEEGTDHSGATMASWTVGDVHLGVGELECVLCEVVAIDAPPAFRERGIDGIVSPHQLHPSALAVIDTVAEALLLIEGTDGEVRGFLQARSPDLELLQLPRDPRFPTIVVRAAIDGFAEIPTLLNTGGKATEFSATAVPGLVATGSERLGGGVSGTDYAGAFVGPRTLVVGNRRLTVPALAVRETMHDPQGIVGMDVLHGTVLAAASAVTRPVFWLAPFAAGD